ncbi:hypothetical protein M501DRAFT_1003971 [Patellaria atrata CBS 101060]|uniref:DRBM domain-containing protein n=1 Tax=Patellaria atrata CBS 101060 TaxID=1346257 RepID=A0A9P4SD12_9PEZI|nr:hypothetical protein M501DRAFT_1003971 [Patellaria atrata CBS 101060]
MDLRRSLIVPKRKRGSTPEDEPQTSSTMTTLNNEIAPATSAHVQATDTSTDASFEHITGFTSVEVFDKMQDEGAKPRNTGPVPLGLPHNPENIAQLYHECQTRGIVLNISYEEVEPQRFTARLEFAGRVSRVIDTPGNYHSKKEAKGVAAIMGLKFFEELGPEPKKAERIANGAGESMNWVGDLIEFIHKRGAVAPIWQDYQSGSLFSCEVIVDLRPDRENVLFGGKEKLFSNKKAAKTNAAQEAIEWLRENDYLNDQSPTKKQKRAKAKAAAPTMDVKEVVECAANVEKSAAQEVNELCQLLGLSCPEYHFTSLKHAPGMLSGYATFKNNPEIPNPIGEADNIFGKKSAKDQIAKGVLAYLTRLSKKRQEEADKLIADIDAME